MAVVVLASAGGAPGTTTAALGLALAWPRPVLLVEADPAGASAVLAGFCRGTLPHDRGVVDLAVAHRNGEEVAGRLDGVALELPGTALRVVPGPSGAASASALPDLWPVLVPVLRGLHSDGCDVLVDYGRLGTHGSAEALLAAADLTLIVTRCRLVDVATTRARAAVLLAGEGPGVPPADAVRLLLVGEGRPYDRREIAAAVGLPVAGALPWDATGAAVYSDGAPRPRRGSKLDRAIAAAAASMSAWLADRPALRGAA